MPATATPKPNPRTTAATALHLDPSAAEQIAPRCASAPPTA